MKRFRSLLLTGIGILVMTIVVWFARGRAQEEGKPKKGSKIQETPVAPLPSSLDTLFPPQAEQPVYLIRMLGLGGRFSAILANLSENDLQHAKTNLAGFKAEYIEISKLVPEWEKEYPMGPVEELEAALNTGDPGKVMAAHDKVRKVCHACHVVYMPRAQHKYHWGKFDAIRIKDPLIHEELDFPGLMKYLDANFAGIRSDAENGQWENARRQLQGFNARFQAMKETCKYCHGTERKYYVDESVQVLVGKLGQALTGSSMDPKSVEALTQRIGLESCFKCHLVHVPAAYAGF